MVIVVINYSWRYFMQKFGEESGLSNSVCNYLKKIIMKLEELTIEDLSIYYGYPLIELDKQESVMKGCIICRYGIIALYEEDSEKNVYIRHLTQMIMSSPKLSELYFSQKPILECVKIDDMNSILKCLDLNREQLLSHEEYLQVNSIIQNVYGMNISDNRKILRKNSLGEIIKKRNNAMNMLDQNQFNGIYNKINTHMRIRGLAGSGKTILLVKKMAYTHFKFRDLDLAYVFYTKSLKQYVEELFKLYYKDFEKYKEPDMDKIHILHSWGGNEMKGFYSKICEDNDFPRRTYRSAQSLNGIDKYEAICREVLQKTKGKIKQTFDYIFVDEAQDFNLSFFKLALHTLKYKGKLIYAYDELQSLNSTVPMPSKKDIFGFEECEDINLSVCYRTPKEILVTAHALGLGIYRKKKDGSPDIVNMMEDYTIWRAVGYKEKEGHLNYGEHVVLERDEAIEYKPQKCVEIKAVPDINRQNVEVAEEIMHLVEEEDVLLEDILIIDLSDLNLQDDFDLFKKAFLQEKEKRNHSEYRVHLVNKDNAIKFKREGSITYTTIFRAKGNEANIVFVLNAHKTSNVLTYARNRLFTAMTRAKFKTYVYGVEGDVMETLSAEYQDVCNKNYLLDFVYPTEDELKEMKSIAKKESEKMDTKKKVYKDIGNNTEITLEVLKEQIGVASLKDLIKELEKYPNE